MTPQPAGSVHPAAVGRRGQSGRCGQSGRRAVTWLLAGGLVWAAGAAPAALAQAAPAPDAGAWQEFQGAWTAAGHREAMALGGDHRASIADFDGSLMLTGASRPALGFRAQAIVFNDSVTGMVGRAVWTDDVGDQAYSELRGSADAKGNRIVGTFLGGTGRYAGVVGEYEFSWRFLIESEDGVVQGQSTGLKGRVRGVTPRAGGARP